MVRVVIHESIVFFFCGLYKFLITWNIQSESSMLLIWSTGVIMVKIYQVAFVSIISIHFYYLLCTMARFVGTQLECLVCD